MPRSSSCRARSTGWRTLRAGSLTMAVVLAALLPVFLLIVLGLRPEANPDAAGDAMAWAGTADLLRAVPGACWCRRWSRPTSARCRSPASAARCCCRRCRCRWSVPCAAAPARPRAVDGPAFTSIFQGATRWQTYVALAVSGNLFGDLGLALASVAMVAIIPLVNVFSVCGAGPLRLAGKALGRRHRLTVVQQSADLGLRDRARAQRHRTFRCPDSGTRWRTRSAAPRSPSAYW